jgi:hypothetical protein
MAEDSAANKTEHVASVEIVRYEEAKILKPKSMPTLTTPAVAAASL